MSVKNAEDEKIGDVNNFIVSLSSGRIIAVIVSSGGVLGMGGELSAMPPTALKLNSEHDALVLNVSKEQLMVAPHFNRGQWPDFTRQSYSEKIYDAYQVSPYFSTNHVS